MAIAIGALLDAKGFLVAVLASVPTLVLAGLAAVYLFDRITDEQSEQRRLEQWRRVRAATLAAIWEQTRRMMEPIRERSPHDVFSVDYEKAIELMEEVHEWIGEQAVPLPESDGEGLAAYEACKSDLQALHASVFEEYRYLRDLLGPRLLEFATDTDLLELLFALEAAERQWSGCVKVAAPGETEGGWAKFPETAWKTTATFYQAATDVVRYISSHPDCPDPNDLRLVLVKVGGRDVSRTWTMYEP